MKILWIVLALLFSAVHAQAATYWVRPTGILGGCLGSATAPATDAGYVSTIAAGLACMSTGDTLNIRAGTYAENIDTAAGHNVVGTGASYAAATTIQAYNGEVVTLRPSKANDVIIRVTAAAGETRRYIIFKDLILDGVNMTSQTAIYGVVTSGHSSSIVRQIKFDGLEIKNIGGQPQNPGNGFGISGEATGTQGGEVWVTRTRVHDGGATRINPSDGIGHCFYVEGSGGLYEDNECYNWKGYGIHQYAANGSGGNIYRRNKIHNTGTDIGRTAWAILIDSVGNNQVYNNLVYNNQNGITVTTNDNIIYNNTVYGNGINQPCADLCDNAIQLFGSTNSSVRNNIVYNNAVNSIGTAGATTPTVNTNLFTNPLFADAANFDFRLCTGPGAPNTACVSASAAIGTGTDLSAYFSTDFTNSARVAPWTIGAYGPGAGVVPPACPATPALVASWGFDGNGTDSSGNLNDAVLGSGLSYAPGKYGQALLFNGTAAATVADSLTQYLCTGFTLSGSLYQTSSSTTFSAMVFKSSYWAYGTSDGSYGFLSGPMGGYSQNGDVYVGYSTSFSTGTWTDWAITYDATLPTANLKLWINGTIVTTANGQATLAQGTGALYIGGSSFGEFLPSGWKLDEVRIYNHARTQTQINTDRNTAITTVVPGVDPQVLLRLPASATGLKLAASATAFKVSGGIPTTASVLLLEGGGTDCLLLEGGGSDCLALEQ